jgi:transposase
VLAFTIAAEIGQIERFPSPEKLAGYTGGRSARRRAGGDLARERSHRLSR